MQIARMPVPAGDLAMQRDKAAACMLFLSGARAAAFTTLPILAVSLEHHSIDQLPSLGVKTKMNHSRTTYLLQIPELLAVIQEWDARVHAELPPSCPWYTVIESNWGDRRLSDKDPGSNRVIALDKRLELLMTVAGLTYKSAHKYRHGHAVYGLMHSSTRITDETYAFLSEGEVREHILWLAGNPIVSPNGELEAIIRSSGKEELGHALEVIGRMISG